MSITTQNWDGVTAPSASIAGWTVDSGWATETSLHQSSPNGIGLASTFTGYKFLTYNTADGAGGNVVATAKFYLDDSYQDNGFALVVRGNASPLTTSGTFYAVEVTNNYNSLATWKITLSKWSGGTQTPIASIGSISSSNIGNAWFQLQLNANGSSLGVTLVRSSDGHYLTSSGTWGSAVVTAITATDSSIAGSGYAGMYAWGQFSLGSPVYTDDYTLDTLGTSVTASVSPLSGSASLPSVAVSAGTSASASAISGSVSLPSATVSISLGNLIGVGTLGASAASTDASAVTNPLHGSAGLGSNPSESLGATDSADPLAAAGVLSSAAIDLHDFTVFVQPLDATGTLGIDPAGLVVVASAAAISGSASLSSVTLKLGFTAFAATLPAAGSLGAGQGIGSGATIAAAPLATGAVLTAVSLATQGNVTASAGPLVGAATVTTVRTWLNVGDTLYNVYRNSGDGGPIDYTNPVTILSSTSWSTGSLAYPGHWKFGVRCYSLRFGMEEKNLDARWELILDASGSDVTLRPMPPSALRAIPRQGGTIRVEWSYPTRDASKVPTGFHVYAGTTGSPNYATAVATATYDGGVNFLADIPSLTDGRQYWFGVRAFNGSGEEPNTSAVSAIADATGPSPPISLTAVTS